MVEFAKGQVQLHPDISNVFKKFAAINVNDAEGACHRLFVELGYAAPVKIHYIHLADQRRLSKFPFVKLSDWSQWLLDSGRIWRLFCGCKSYSSMKVVLAEWWNRFKQLSPQHAVFRSGCDLSITIPYFTHQDEGRGFKKQAIWVFSAHGSVGRGTQEYIRRNQSRLSIGEQELGMNFVGSTWATHVPMCTMLRAVLSSCPEAIDKVMECFAEDASKLWLQGLTSMDGTRRIYMVHLCTKADLPALVKIGKLQRSFSHVARQAQSRTAANGICHMCLAGQEEDGSGRGNVPYEDFSLNPLWWNTLEAVEPWDEEPKIFNNALLDRTRLSQFFATDIWHNLHLGAGKHWVAHAFVSAIEKLTFWPEISVESRFEFLTTKFKEYCREHHISPFMDEISRASMGYLSSSACPVGQWSKGIITTHMMKFVEHFCNEYVVGKTGDQTMLAIVS